MLTWNKHERFPHPRHPVRNYLILATLTISSILAVSFLLDRPAVGQRVELEQVRGDKKRAGEHEKLAGLVPLAPDAADASCRLNGGLIPLPEIPEASGVAASQRTPGVLWIHKDSGKPVLLAVDARGALKGRVLVPAVAIEDWEDLAVAACREGSCLYIADIGDNGEKRARITVYRVPEPLPSDSTTRPAEAFHATYPDGSQDAEALLVSKQGRVFVVTKGNSGPIGVYRFPQPLHAGASVRLEKIASMEGRTSKDERITGASVSPDGAWVALRTHDAVLFYAADAFFGGRLSGPQRFDVTSLAEPQGEGVALGSGGELFLVGEGGGKSRAGSLARALCTLAPASK